MQYKRRQYRIRKNFRGGFNFVVFVDDKIPRNFFIYKDCNPRNFINIVTNKSTNNTIAMPQPTVTTSLTSLYIYCKSAPHCKRASDLWHVPIFLVNDQLPRRLHSSSLQQRTDHVRCAFPLTEQLLPNLRSPNRLVLVKPTDHRFEFIACHHI